MNQYVSATPLLDYGSATIQDLIEQMGWKKLGETVRICAVYNFVRDTIRFGYSSRDEKTASEVLSDGYGQCNTKGILLMALLRGTGIPCRFHGSIVDKQFQNGVMPSLVYWLSPKTIVHGWVEVFHAGKWLNMEGVVIDEEYILSIRQRCGAASSPFSGFGISTDDLSDLRIYWNGGDTYIQKNAITADLGIFDDPDSFFSSHAQRLNFLSRWLYSRFASRMITAKADRLRKGM